MLNADGTFSYPWNHGEVLTAAALNAAIANAGMTGSVTMGGPLHMGSYPFDNASADGNSTALITPNWTACWPVANAPDPSQGSGNAVRGQMVVQSQTTLDTTFQEWTAVFGTYANTGTPTGQKVTVYSGGVQGPQGGPLWTLNTCIVRNGVPGPASNVPGGPSHIGSSTPGTPGAISTSTATIGYELDFSNWDQDCAPGGAFAVGMYIRTNSIFASLAGIYYDSTPINAGHNNYAWHNAIYFAGQYTAEDNTIYDATNAQYSYQATGTRSGATFYSNDTAPIGLAIHGNHSGADIQALDNAPVVLSVYGGTHTNVVDVSSTTISGVAWNGPFSATSINNTPIGGTTPAAASVTGLTVTTGNGVDAAGTNTLYLGNATHGGAVAIVDGGGASANLIQMMPGTPGFGPAIQAIGSDTNVPLNLYAKGTGQIALRSNVVATAGIDNSIIGATTPAAASVTGLTVTTGTGVNAASTNTLYLGNVARGGIIAITDPGGAVANLLQLYGNTTGFGPTIACIGSDTNIQLNVYAKGSGTIVFQSNSQTTGSLAIGSGGGPTIRAGTGAATGTQPSGSLWLRTDGTSGARLYVSAGGGTWTAVATV